MGGRRRRRGRRIKQAGPYSPQRAAKEYETGGIQWSGPGSSGRPAHVRQQSLLRRPRRRPRRTPAVGRRRHPAVGVGQQKGGGAGQARAAVAALGLVHPKQRRRAEERDPQVRDRAGAALDGYGGAFRHECTLVVGLAKCHAEAERDGSESAGTNQIKNRCAHTGSVCLERGGDAAIG